MITAIADGSQVAEARRLVGDFARSHGLPEPRRAQIAIVVTELATNLLKHGGGGHILADVFDDRDGTGPDGRDREVVTIDVETGDRDEERSRMAAAGVVLDGRHLGVITARGVETRLAEELGEQHRCPAPTPDPGRPSPRTPRARRRWCGT